MKPVVVSRTKVTRQVEPNRRLAHVASEAVTNDLDRAAARPVERRAMDQVLDEHAELLARLAR